MACKDTSTGRLGAEMRLCLLLGAVVCTGGWANSPPAVSNVHASQRRDGSNQVDIRYDLADVDGDACTVSLEISEDGGRTWSVRATHLSGHVGAGVSPGEDRAIAWDCAADLPGAFGDRYKVRVIADDGKSAPWRQYREIAAGSFEMGDTAGIGNPDEQPVHPVSVGAFVMQATHVTNEQYCEFLNAAMTGGQVELRDGVVYLRGHDIGLLSTRAVDPMSRIHLRDGPFAVLADHETHPVVAVSWHGAAAYCNWLSETEGRGRCYNPATWACDLKADGYRLPTEAEWEYAARGGIVGGLYPWGDQPDGARANWFGSGDRWESGPYPQTTPVGHYPANGYGLCDMAGNVWQWCNDAYSGSFYSVSPAADPTGPATGDKKVVRGGCWKFFATQCRVSSRSNALPAARQGNIGFRVARGLR